MVACGGWTTTPAGGVSMRMPACGWWAGNMLLILLVLLLPILRKQHEFEWRTCSLVHVDLHKLAD